MVFEVSIINDSHIDGPPCTILVYVVDASAFNLDALKSTPREMHVFSRVLLKTKNFLGFFCLHFILNKIKVEIILICECSFHTALQHLTRIQNLIYIYSYIA